MPNQGKRGTLFCKVNKLRDTSFGCQILHVSLIIGYKNKSARNTPEPRLSYIQLDLKSNGKQPKEAKSQMKLPLETARKDSKNGLVDEKSATMSNGEPSTGK